MKQRSNSPKKKPATYSFFYVAYKLDSAEDRKAEATKWLEIIKKQKANQKNSDDNDTESSLMLLMNELDIPFKRKSQRDSERVAERKQKNKSK